MATKLDKPITVTITLRIGEWAPEILPNGSIKVGCTTVDAATVDRLAELSRKARTESKEDEWPKFWRSREKAVFRAIDKNCDGQFWSKNNNTWEDCYKFKTPLAEDANSRPKDLTPITRAKAAKIIGRNPCE